MILFATIEKTTLEVFLSPLQGQVVLSCGKYFKQLKTQLAVFQ